MLSRFTLAALVLLLVPSLARSEIVVGVAGPLSGSFAAVGEEMRAGAEAAVQAVNRAGGIGGERLRLEVVDDRCDAETGAAVANRLVGRGARLIVGHACTAAALAAARVYAEAGIVLISPAATNPRLTDERVGPGIFRLAVRSDGQARALAARLVAGGVDRRVGFVHDGSVYGQGLADAARAAFEAAGGKAAFTDSFTPGEESQNALVGRIQDAALSVLVVGALQADAAVILRELRDRGLAPEVLGSEALGLAEFPALAGPLADGVLFALPPDARETPAAAEAVAAFRARGLEPSGATLPAYAAVEAYAAAAAADRDFPAVVARLRAGPLTTVLGPVTFDDKGDWREGAWVLHTWRDGALVKVD